MSSPPPSPSYRPQATPTSSSSISGPYGPKNTLDKATPPGFVASNNRFHGSPKFGSTTPMKSAIAPISGTQASTAVDRRLDYGTGEGDSGSDYTKHDGHRNEQRHPEEPVHRHVPAVIARRSEFMQPLPLGGPKDAWRPRKPTNPTSAIDLTAIDDQLPVVIPRPQGAPSFHSTYRGGPPSSGFKSVNQGTQNVIDLTKQNRRFPPTFSIPGGGAIPGADGTYYGGTYVDNEKTTESIKELLEGINDFPTTRRGRRKKTKK
ncbi:hypothetical protein HOY80DRAFT_919807, partial [Tuber brumale]